MERLGVSGKEAASAVLVADGPVALAQPDVVTGGGPVEGGGRTVPRWARAIGFSLLAAQLIVMVAFSTLQYSRYTLTGDFAIDSQAWWAIAHGHLNPFSTGLGVIFWKNNAEFVMWPLSLLSYVDPHPVVLLWIQDLALVMTEFIALRWILAVIGRAGGKVDRRAVPWLFIGVALIVVVNPSAYETIAFDFHMEPIATLFVLLVGYDLWAGRTRRLWWWVALALLSTGVSGIYLVGVGISGILAGPRTRRSAVAIAGVGLAWLLLLSNVGGVGFGGHLGSSYGYLVGSHQGRIGVPNLVVGVFTHPGSVVHVVGSHWFIIFAFLVMVGFVGVFSAWGFGMAFVVLLPNLLDGSGLFVRFVASFQSWPALPFVLVGSVMVVLALPGKGETVRRIAVVIAAVLVVLLAELAFVGLPAVPRAWLSIDAATAAELSRVAPHIPPDAEVIASEAVVGRFGQRLVVYSYLGVGQTFAVDRRQVVVVLTPKEGTDDGLPTGQSDVAVAFLKDRLHARVLAARSGVYAFAWSPPPGTTEIALP